MQSAADGRMSLEEIRQNEGFEDFRPLLDQFYYWEDQQGERCWLKQPTSEGWLEFTWAEAGRQARKGAAYLLDLGLQPGDRVAIYSANSAYWYMADLAIMMAGMVSVPIYASMPEDKMSYILEDAEAKAIFMGEGCATPVANLLAKLPGRVVDIAPNNQITGASEAKTWQQVQSESTPIPGSPSRDPDELWTIVYTSGTTGAPKGVMHSFTSLPISSFEICRFLIQSNTDDVFFSYMPLAHIAERGALQGNCIYAGATVAFNSSQEAFIDELRTIRPTIFLAVPRIWVKLKEGLVNAIGQNAWTALFSNPDMLAETGPKLVASLGIDRARFAFSGAAPIAPEDLKEWNALGIPLFEAFGQSELLTGPMNKRGANKLGSVGREFSPLSKLKVSEQGELLMSSPGLMLGYYKAPEKTAETIVDGWLHTGDKAVMDDEGYVTITGRVKELFKTAKGKYVSPAPIENQISNHPMIAQLCLVGRGMIQTRLLVVLADSARELSREEVETALATRLNELNSTLEAHERIDHILICDEPWTVENRLLTPTMKIVRSDVEEKYLDMIRACEKEDLPQIVWES